MPNTFYQLERTTKITYDVTHRVFNENLVWLDVKENLWKVVQIADVDPSRYRCSSAEAKKRPQDIVYNNQLQIKNWGICVPINFFNKMIEIHGIDPSWVVDHWSNAYMGIDLASDRNTVMSAVTQKYMDLYLAGNRQTVKDSYLDEEPKTQDVLTTLLNEQYHLIVREDGNWVFWDCNNSPVIRNFCPDDYDNPFQGSKYNLAPLAEHVKSISGVSNVQIRNSDQTSGKVMRFSYKPQNTTEMLQLCDVPAFRRGEKFEEFMSASPFTKQRN